MHRPRRELLKLLLLGPATLAAGAQPRATSPAAGRRTVTLRVQSNGDLLEFAPRELHCPANVRVRVEFHNAAKYVAFRHNWVLIRPGTFDAVTAAGEAAGEDHDWVPRGNPAIIAATTLCDRGQTVFVEFDAPPPGRYLYICTTPGHAQSMWGVFTVEDQGESQ